MSAKSLRSARSGGIAVAVSLIAVLAAMVSPSSGATNTSVQFAKAAQSQTGFLPLRTEYVWHNGTRFSWLPTTLTQLHQHFRIDRRIYDDVVWMAKAYRQEFTDAYQPVGLGGHHTAGDHPKGVAVDLGPDSSRGGTWNDTLHLAIALGWQPSCVRSSAFVDPTGSNGCLDRLSQINTPARWIGYNGTICHGDPSHVYGGCGPHLHVSFKSTPGTANGGWPNQVERFAVPGTLPDPASQPAKPTDGTVSSPNGYPLDIPEDVKISGLDQSGVTPAAASQPQTVVISGLDTNPSPPASPTVTASVEISGLTPSDGSLAKLVAPITPPPAVPSDSHGHWVGNEYWYHANYGDTSWVQRLQGDDALRQRAAKVAGIVNAAAKQYHLQPELLAAQIVQESGFDNHAVSYTGAVGIMQLEPSTAKMLGVTDSTNPQQCIFGGAKYMRQILNRWHGDLYTALQGYEAGPEAPWNAVTDYAPNILAMRDHLLAK